MDASSDPLQNNDYKFWLTFEQTAVGIAIVRPDGRLMRANPELCSFLGYKESELQELRLDDITHRDDREVERSLSKRLNSGELPTYRTEKRFIGRNSKVVWGLQSTSLLRDRLGKPLQYILIIQDITALKAAQETLEPAAAAQQPSPSKDTISDDAILLQFLSALPIGMLVVDHEGQPYFANDAARRILGQNIAPGAEETTDGEPSEKYTAYKSGTDEQYPIEDAPISRALMGHSVVVGDLEIHGPDAAVPVQVWAAPVYDAQGKLTHAIAAISERPQSERPVHIQADDSSLARLLRFAADVATAISLTSDLHEAMQICLEKVCDMTGLPAGHMLLARGDHKAHGGAYVRLTTSSVWHVAEPDRFRDFRRASEAMTFGPGEGLPGHVLATREAAWTTDLNPRTTSSRSKHGHAAGITTELAFPLVAEGVALGVMEFFSHEAVEPDPAFLEVMAQIGAHMGNAILRRTAADELARTRTRYETFSEITADFVSAHDVEGKYIFAGKAGQLLLGYSAQELAGSSALTYCHPEDVAMLERAFSTYLAGSDEQINIKYRTRHKNGEYVWMDMSAQPLTGTYGRGREIICVARSSQEQSLDTQPQEVAPTEEPVSVTQTISDAGSEISTTSHNLQFPPPTPYFFAQPEAEEPTNKDTLTGLHDREVTDELLTTKLTSRRASTFPVGCLFIDVDNFDALNSAYGEERCNEALKRVAGLIEETCRDDDFLGRHSGSTFVIALPNTDAAGTIIVGEKVLRKVRAIDWSELGIEEPLRVSIGGTSIRHGNTMDLPELMEMLGSQLLQAKGSGGDCIIMNAREAARQSSVIDPLGGWTHTLRIALNGQIPGAAPGTSRPPESGNQGD